MTDIQLSKHFKLSEFTKSSTASVRGIKNVPNEEQVSNLKALCVNVLEPLRQHFDTPVVISSGYRCPALNKAVGGASISQHMTGEACDIRIPSLAEGRQWMEWIATYTHFDQCIMEHCKNKDGTTSHWIHVSHSRQHNRYNVISNLWKK